MQGRPTLDALLATDVESYLPYDLLVKMDVATMANSMEARSPFLDHKVMEFCARLPVEYKIRGRTLKYLLKKMAADLVPAANIKRRKMGFGVPVGRWMKGVQLGLCERDSVIPARTQARLFSPRDVAGTGDKHRRGATGLLATTVGSGLARDVAPDVCGLICPVAQSRIAHGPGSHCRQLGLGDLQLSPAAGGRVGQGGLRRDPGLSAGNLCRTDPGHAGYRVELWPLFAAQHQPAGGIAGRRAASFALCAARAHCGSSLHFETEFLWVARRLHAGIQQAVGDQYLHRTGFFLFEPPPGARCCVAVVLPLLRPSLRQKSNWTIFQN